MSTPQNRIPIDGKGVRSAIGLLDRCFTHLSLREMVPVAYYDYGERFDDRPLPLPSHVPERDMKRVRSVFDGFVPKDELRSRTAPVCWATLREDGPVEPVYRWSLSPEEGWLHGELSRDKFEELARRCGERAVLAEAPRTLKLYTRLHRPSEPQSNPAIMSAFEEEGLERKLRPLWAEWDELESHPPRSPSAVREWFNSSVTSTRLHLARWLFARYFQTGLPAFMTLNVDRNPIKPHGLYSLDLETRVAVYFGGCPTADELMRPHRYYCDAFIEYVPRYEVW